MSRVIYKTKFRRSVKELKEFIKENDIKLLGLLGYLRKRSNKKIQKRVKHGLYK